MENETRCNIQNYCRRGQITEMTASWEQTTLPTILSSYNLADIYNADEFGLFYQALPERSLPLKSEKCVGGKHSKIRLTGMAAAKTRRKTSYICDWKVGQTPVFLWSAEYSMQI